MGPNKQTVGVKMNLVVPIVDAAAPVSLERRVS